MPVGHAMAVPQSVAQSAPSDAMYGEETRSMSAGSGGVANSAVTGKFAVEKAKEMNRLKDSMVVADNEKAESGVKTVADKTFYLRDGFWTDSAALAAHHPNLETIEFGSKRYFDLIGSVPGISKYLSVGDQVIFIYKDHGYKIVRSGSPTSTG
jgi:hypothetical protein